MITDRRRTDFLRCSSVTLSTLRAKRGLRSTAVRGVRPLNPTLPPMVGPAFTLRYIPAREDLDAHGPNGDLANKRRQAIEMAPEGLVFVADCRNQGDIASILACQFVLPKPVADTLVLGDGNGLQVAPLRAQAQSVIVRTGTTEAGVRGSIWGTPNGLPAMSRS